MTRWAFWRRHWPSVVVIVAPAILFWQLLFTGRVLFWGLPLLQFYPWRWLALRQIEAGHVPLWNPYLGNGTPLLANYQTAVFYPPNWLGFLPGIPLDYSLGLVGVLHILWAGLGMVAFTRAQRLGGLAQAVAGLAFALSGYLVARLTFLTIIAAAAWLPWLLWAVTNLVAAMQGGPDDARRTRRIIGWLLALAGLMALQLLAGHAQTTFYSLALAVAWGAWLAWRPVADGNDTGERARRVGQLVVGLGTALAFAIALSALQLLPTAELLRQSPRAKGADYEFVVNYSFWPWRLFSLVAPDAFGNPGRGDFWGRGNYWEDAAYVGVLPLGLALLAVIAWGRATLNKSDELPAPHPALRAVPFLLCVAATSILLALGSNTPVFPFLYRYVPTFNEFQAPARMMIGYVLAVSLLAGLGAEAWTNPTGRWRSWTARGVTAGLGLTLAGGAIYVLPQTVARTPGALTELLGTMPRALALTGLLVAASFGLSLLRPVEGGAVWQATVIAFVGLDLIAAGWLLNPAADPSLYRQPTASGAALADVLDGKRLYEFAQDEYGLKFNIFFRFKSFSPPRGGWQAVREAQVPNVGLLEGIASANNFDPLLSARYSALLDALQTADQIHVMALLRGMDVQTVLSSKPLEGMEAAYQGKSFTVYRVPGQAARVRIAASVMAASGLEEARTEIAEAGFDPDRQTVIEAQTALGGASSGSATLLTDSPTHITIAAAMDSPGYLVLADTYYPGWQATVDGQAAEVVPANVAYRAVFVPAGQHQVEFRYAPTSWRIGLGLSVLAWLVFAALAAWVRTKSAGPA